MQDTFQWTDELVLEFANRRNELMVHDYHLEQFKSSKSPKKEWEIVAFQEIDCGAIYTLFTDGKYRTKGHEDKPGYSQDNMIADGDIIHSVRRLSDDWTVSVKDKAKTVSGKIGTIQAINADGHILFSDITGLEHITTIQKLPQPVLTTVDGFELFEDRDVIVVYLKDHSCSIGPLSGFHPDILDNNKVFVYDYNAQQYIFENKPLLSLNDVKEAWASDRSFVGTDWLLEKLTALVKQKLNQ